MRAEYVQFMFLFLQIRSEGTGKKKIITHEKYKLYSLKLRHAMQIEKTQVYPHTTTKP